MDWQLLLVTVVVLLSLVYLGRRMLRGWRGQGAGCGGCTAKSHHGVAPTLIPSEQIRLRRR